MVSWAPRLPPAVSGSGLRCGRVCWARVSLVPSPSWLGCRGVFFALWFFLFFSFFFRALWSLSLHPLSFGLGWWLSFFFFFRVPFPRGPLFLAWCCRFWVGGPPVPLLGSFFRCLLGGGLGRLWWCWRAVWRLWAVFVPFPPPPSFFLGGGGGLPVPPSAFPGLAHALACIQCCLPGCCLQLRSVWPRSGPMGRVGLVHGGLGAPSCRVRSWLCGWAAVPGGCLWFWVRGLGLFVSFPLCGAGCNLLGGPPPLSPGALWPRVWPAVLVCGVVARRLPGCAVAGFG